MDHDATEIGVLGDGALLREVHRWVERTRFLDMPYRPTHPAETAQRALTRSCDERTRQTPMTRPQRKQVAVRYLLLGCSFLVVGALALGLFSVHGSSETAITYMNGRSVVQSQPGQTAYQTNPTAIAVILLALLAACGTSGVSLTFRVLHRSPSLGIAGLVVGAIVGIIAILGILTVGPYILPLAGLLIVIALPLDTFAEAPGVTRPA
jgi:hypothetical protein